jgi:hypothetical protein
VQITGWDWSYSFSSNVTPHDDRQYGDYRHLLIRGTVLRPLRIKADTAELLFLPNVTPAEMARCTDPPPRGVGSLDVRGSILTGYLSMPLDALDPVLQMLLADRFKYVLLDGEPMRYRKAIIRHYEFTAQHNEEDYPDDN